MKLTLQIGKWIAPVLIVGVLSFSIAIFMAPQARAAGAFVQAKGGSGNTAVPTVTFTSTPVSGDLIVIAIGTSQSVTITCTGYTALKNVNSGSGGSAEGFRMFYKVSDGTETSPSCSLSSGFWGMVAGEYSGINSASVLNVSDARNNAGNTVQSTPTVTATTTNETFVVAAFYSRTASPTWSNTTVNSSATGVQDRTTGGTTNVGIDLSDKLGINPTSGTFAASSTESGTAVVGSGGIAIFNVVATAATSTTTGQSSFRVRQATLYIRNVSVQIR